MTSFDVLIRDRSELENKVWFLVCIIIFYHEIFCHVMSILIGLIICRTVCEFAIVAGLHITSFDVLIRDRSELENKVWFLVCIIIFYHEIFCHVMSILTGLIICRTVCEFAIVAGLHMTSFDVLIRDRSELENKVWFLVCIIIFYHEIFCHVMSILTGLIICRIVYEFAIVAELSILWWSITCYLLSDDQKTCIKGSPFVWLLMVDRDLQMRRMLVRELCCRFVKKNYGFEIRSQVFSFYKVENCGRESWSRKGIKWLPTKEFIWFQSCYYYNDLWGIT